MPTTASRAVGRLLRNTNRSRESYPYHQLLGTSVKKATICSEIPEMLPTKKLSKILKTDKLWPTAQHVNTASDVYVVVTFHVVR